MVTNLKKLLISTKWKIIIIVAAVISISVVFLTYYANDQIRRTLDLDYYRTNDLVGDYFSNRQFDKSNTLHSLFSDAVSYGNSDTYIETDRISGEFNYYILKDGKEYTNTSMNPEDFGSEKAYMLFSNDNGVVAAESNIVGYLPFSFDNYQIYSTSKLYVALKAHMYDHYEDVYYGNRNPYIFNFIVYRLFYFIFVFLQLIFITSCVLSYIGEHKNAKVRFYDKIWIEVIIIANLFLYFLFPYAVGEIMVLGIGMSLASFIVIPATMLVVMHIVRLICLKRLDNASFIAKFIVHPVIRAVKSLRKTVTIRARLLVSVGIILGVYSFAMMLLTGFNETAFIVAIFFSLFCFIAISLVLRTTSHKLDKIAKNLKQISEGNITEKLPDMGGSPIGRMANDVNHISEGLQVAIEKEIVAERMKSELVTNVSHDLRTPMTSILTYIDLIKTEGLQSENAHKYFDIIDQKSKRLQTLTDDLLSISKASSGNIEVSLEKIDLRALINQSLGELTDKVTSANLDFRVSGENVYVLSDGKLLWRVIDNLFSNIFKYAMPSSRVYVSVLSDELHGILQFKNISQNELPTVPQLLAERFTRGDESRNSEGSGLGLAIAKSFTESQQGEFAIDVDGDLFKVTIKIPLV